MNPQKIGKLFAWLFIGTWITAIAARLLFVNGLDGTWKDLAFIPGAGSDTQMQVGAIFEFLLIIANIGTAVVLYPLVKRVSESVALGYVTARIMESAFIMVGLLSLMSVVTLRQDFGADSSVIAAGNSLVSTYEWAFQFGPGLVVGFGNGLMLGYLMYRSGLVPRRLAMLGLVAGPLLILSFVLILFGVHENGSGTSNLLYLPEMVWELALPIYILVRGFRPTAITTIDVRDPVGSSMAAV